MKYRLVKILGIALHTYIGNHSLLICVSKQCYKYSISSDHYKLGM